MPRKKAGKGFRLERDMLGEMPVPADALHGIHTARALAAFPAHGSVLGDFPCFVRAFIRFKQAAARANTRLGLLPREIGESIEDACRVLSDGDFRAHFPVPMLHGGGGTSANMNFNEVIANLAGRSLGDAPGSYARVHPLDHVNLGQSTNDAYPSAARVALFEMTSGLAAPLGELVRSLRRKRDEFSGVVKIGRTCLQDAVPMTLGDEFSGYASLVERAAGNLASQAGQLAELNLGATAVGTGLGRDPRFPALALAELNRLSGGCFRISENLFDATQNCDCFLSLSGALKNLALALSRVASDLRLLSSGPESGFGEIRLPPVQAGSSIMPGKVNPAIPELVNQVAYRVCGADLTVTMALERGELELNIMEPVMVLSLAESIEMLSRTVPVFDRQCVRGITADEERCRRYAGSRIAVYTVLSARLGYAAVSRLVERSRKEGRDIRDLVVEEGLLDPASLAECLGSGPASGEGRARG